MMEDIIKLTCDCQINGNGNEPKKNLEEKISAFLVKIMCNNTIKMC